MEQRDSSTLQSRRGSIRQCADRFGRIDDAALQRSLRMVEINMLPASEMQQPLPALPGRNRDDLRTIALADDGIDETGISGGSRRSFPDSVEPEMAVTGQCGAAEPRGVGARHHQGIECSRIGWRPIDGAYSEEWRDDRLEAQGRRAGGSCGRTGLGPQDDQRRHGPNMARSAGLALASSSAARA